MEYISNLGMPYMGSKRKLAKPIMDYIIRNNPDIRYFYDIFGGGGAMSFEAIQRPRLREVFYNDFNTGVVELLKKIKNDGVTDDFYKWVTREEFKKHKNDKTWFGGLCAVIWSFGSGQGTYLFGESEYNKKLLHEIIVDKNVESLKIFNDKYNVDIKMNTFFDETIYQKRLRIISYLKKKLGRSDLQHLERLQQLERLEQLKKLPFSERLKISNMSYEDVKINTPKNETIIYLDPPYINTKKYTHDINHDDFYKWVDKLTKNGYKIYLSSYESDLECVKTFTHRSTFSQTANNEVEENLFTNSVPVLDTSPDEEW